jgi:hypothetical protein
LDGALWPEVTRHIRTAKIPLGFEVKHHVLQVIDPSNRRPFDEHFVRFFVTRVVENFQGVHLPWEEPNPRVLYVFDEASGVPDDFYEAAQAQAHRMLVIGNPLGTTNFFYRQTKKGNSPDPERENKPERTVIHIDGDDSPNVVAGRLWRKRGHEGTPPTVIPGLLSWGQYQFRVRNWDDVKKRMRLHGHFYEGADMLMFPPQFLDQAEELWEVVQPLKRGPFYMGVDVAEGGRDLNCWAIIDHLGIIEIDAKKSDRDTTMIQTVTLEKMQKFKIPGRRVCFDRGAGGKQHVDYMRRAGHKVRAVGFGEGSTEPKIYQNKRVEMYALLARAFDPARWVMVEVGDQKDKPDEEKLMEWVVGMGLPPDMHLLREELAVLPVMYDAKQRQMLPPKARSGVQREQSPIVTLDSILGRSPDRADALALANWAKVSRKKATPRVDRPLMVGYGGAEDPEPEEGDETPGGIMERVFGKAPKTEGERETLNEIANEAFGDDD